jgi:two-component system, cell cycle sensor histidine kinase and response regulator CckA
LCHELTDLGYQVPAMARSAEEALYLAEAAQPDLVLMDIVLNGRMDGIEASAELRERADIPVVYLTAHADEATLRRAKVTEPYGYLIKPYEERELRTTIETALFKHRMEQLSAAMKRWLQAVFRSIGDALVVTSPKAQISLMNRAAEVLTGWSGDAAFGKPWHEVLRLVDGRTRRRLPDLITAALVESHPLELPEGTLLLARGGAETPLQGTLAAVTDQGGALAGFVLICRDARRLQ